MRFAPFSRALPYVVGAAVLLGLAPAPVGAGASTRGGKTRGCPSDASGLTLPDGFCATIFVDGIGHARHLAVGTNGVVYVNTWSGDYYQFDKVHEGGFLVALENKAGTGKADVVERFGETQKTGGAGGTGIAIYKGWVYAEINDRIVRYSLPPGAPETVVSKLPLGGDHPMHPFIISPEGTLYVDVASATTPANQGIANPRFPATTHARNWRRAAGYGASTRTRQSRRSLQRTGMQLEYAMGRALPLMPRVASL